MDFCVLRRNRQQRLHAQPYDPGKGLRKFEQVIRGFLMVGVLCLMVAASAQAVAPPPTPQPPLIFESSESWRSLANRLRKVDPQVFRTALTMTGLQHPGPAIRVILASEDTPLAERVPPWVVGYASGSSGVIVLLPERVPSYPYGSIESVLWHELAHVLVARAAAGQPVPRWFDEGLAMVVEDRWGLEDRARLVWAMVGGRQLTLAELNELFWKDRASAQHAYVLAKAFVRYLLHEWSRELPAESLALVAQGLPFDEAFFRVTGVPLRDAERAFWSNQTVWNRWLPIITSSATLWMGITLLVLYAYRKQRLRAATIRRRWERDESEE